MEDIRLVKLQDMKSQQLKESGGFIAVIDAKKSLERQNSPSKSDQDNQGSIVSGL